MQVGKGNMEEYCSHRFFANIEGLGQMWKELSPGSPVVGNLTSQPPGEGQGSHSDLDPSQNPSEPFRAG